MDCPFLVMLYGDSVLCVGAFDVGDNGQFWSFDYEFWCEGFCYPSDTDFAIALSGADAFMS